MTIGGPRATVADILHPASVAVFGASDNVAKFGGRIMHYLVKHGFAGRILPINPGRTEVLDRRCYPRIGDAPGPVDVAILAVPPQAVVPAVAECADTGVRCCIVMTTGFAEAGRDGSARQDALVEIVRRTGLRLVGPNCMGLINPHDRLALTSSLVLEVESLLPGRVGLVSQSGALMVSMYNRAHDAGIGFSACVSLGNQADVEICDVLEYMLADPGTDAIALYVEGFRNARRFLALAEEAQGRDKPLLVVKTGRSDAGVRAARSHTASLAGSYAVFEAACRERGVLLTDDPDGMILAADLLRRHAVPGERGIGVLSPSGGGAAIAVDRVTEAGLKLAVLRSGTKDALVEILLPPQADNPIDLGGRRDGDPVAAAERAMSVLAADPGVGAVLVPLTTVPFYEETTRALGSAALRSGKPVLFAVTPGSAAEGPRRILRELGCHYYDRFDDALRVATLWSGRPRALRGRRVAPDRVQAAPDQLEMLRRLPAGMLTAPQVRPVLEAYGIPVAAERMAKTVEEAVSAAAALGYPIALKAVCRGLVHKTDAGAVQIGLTGPDAVALAWDRIAAAVRRLPEVEFQGCTVQEMVEGEAEVIIGARRDEQFGPVVLVGWGGVLVEVLHDVQLAPAPVSAGRAVELLEGLRMWPLLAGVRGRRLDVERVADIVGRVSLLAADLGERLVELDVNPVVVRTAGEGAVAVDCRATLGPDAVSVSTARQEQTKTEAVYDHEQ
ncbi:MAG TPA: acetate--CoA ligase family protein [bacterium]|nr:acetate--CoA ligase family protein [bacterium]